MIQILGTVAYEMVNCKAKPTPMPEPFYDELAEHADDEILRDEQPYWHLVGCFLFLSTSSGQKVQIGQAET